MLDEEVGSSFLKINNILNGTEALTDKYDIEGVLLFMQQSSRKVDFLKELKKRRVASIEEQIAIEEANLEKLEESIKTCLALNKAKSLDFPGVGKVSVRNTKGTWTIVDENGLRSHLESLGKFDEVVEESWRFKKKDLNKLLDELQQNNNTSSFVSKEDDKTSLSISFPKEEVVQSAPLPPVLPPSVNVSNSSSQGLFDALEI